jgi:hypothetical protein
MEWQKRVRKFSVIKRLRIVITAIDKQLFNNLKKFPKQFFQDLKKKSFKLLKILNSKEIKRQT